MKTLGNNVNSLNDVEFASTTEKIEALRKLSATYIELVGTEKQVSYANSLIEREFGENLQKLDKLIETCNKFQHMKNFPTHKQLERKLQLWNEVKNMKEAGDIINKIKNNQ